MPSNLLCHIRFEKAGAQKSPEKAGLIRNELLDCLVEGEKRGFDPTDERGNAALRAASIDWSVSDQDQAKSH